MDLRPAKRIKDPDLLRRLHLRMRECLACGGTYGLTLHHVVLRGQGGDDSEENIIVLCQGPGTQNCHGRWHDGDHEVRAVVESAVESFGSGTTDSLSPLLGGGATG